MLFGAAGAVKFFWPGRVRAGVVYLFADAIYESLRQQPGLKEGILVTRGILSDGSKALIYLSLGSKESYDHWPGHSSGNVATPRLRRSASSGRGQTAPAGPGPLALKATSVDQESTP
jgi:hypothetical protein